MCKHNKALFCRDSSIADNGIITPVTDMHFKMSVSGYTHMLYKIFDLFSLKNGGLRRVCARFFSCQKVSSDKNVCTKTVLQFGQKSIGTATGKRKNKALNTRSYN
jgi:hypothetical protein